MLWFTSDLHLSHKNLALKVRGFSDIEEHDKMIINLYNQQVSSKDDVYIIGDISFAKINKTIELVNLLNGKKHLILGNHDKYLAKKPEFRQLFVSIQDYKEIDVYDYKGNKQRICMMHYPILQWNKCHYGSIMLHGHSHGTIQYPFEGGRILDVGVDVWNYRPIECQYILGLLNRLPPHSIDHHKVKDYE